MINKLEIEQSLSEKVDKLVEARFKRVVRAGKVIRKRVVRPGFKVVRVKGDRTKVKRISPREKRNRHIANLRAWRKNKGARVVHAKRMMKRSMLRRKSIFGG